MGNTGGNHGSQGSINDFVAQVHGALDDAREVAIDQAVAKLEATHRQAALAMRAFEQSGWAKRDAAKEVTSLVAAHAPAAPRTDAERNAHDSATNATYDAQPSPENKDSAKNAEETHVTSAPKQSTQPNVARRAPLPERVLVGEGKVFVDHEGTKTQVRPLDEHQAQRPSTTPRAYEVTEIIKREKR